MKDITKNTTTRRSLLKKVDKIQTFVEINGIKKLFTQTTQILISNHQKKVMNFLERDERRVNVTKTTVKTKRSTLQKKNRRNFSKIKLVKMIIHESITKDIQEHEPKPTRRT